MPAAANIVIKDGATTPADRTFQPAGYVGADKNAAIFVERTSGVLVGQNEIVIARRPANGGPTRKQTIKLTYPTTQSVTDDAGVTTQKVVYQELAAVDFVVSAQSTTQERKHLRCLLGNLMLNALVAQALDNDETFW